MRILLTRPVEDSAPLAERLSADGHSVLIEPLLSIAFVDGPTLDLIGVQALLCTSANGVRALARRTAERDLPVFAVGDATAAAAREAGFARVESAAGDVEDLARLVVERLAPVQGAILHAAGSVTAGDLGAQLGAAGFMLRREVLYSAEPAAALTTAAREALAQDGVDAVAFFSPRTAATFVRLARDAGLEGRLGRVTALALSPAVKAEAEALRWRGVEVAARPDQAALLDLVAEHAARATDSGGDPAGSGTEGMAQQSSPGSPTESGHSSTADTGPGATEAGPAPARPAAAGGVGSGIWFVLGVVLGLGGALASGWWFARQQLPVAMPDTSAGMAQLAQRVSELDRKLAAATAAPPSAAAPNEALDRDVKAQAGRVAALERGIAELQEKLASAAAAGSRVDKALADVAALAARVETAGRGIAELQEKLGGATAALPRLDKAAADVAALAVRIDALEKGEASETAAIEALKAENRRLSQELARAQEGVAKLAADASATATRVTEIRRGDAMLVAVTQLREALRRPGPFADELKALQALSGEDAALAAALPTLATHAAAGVPTLDELRARFAPIAAEMVRMEQIPPDDSWWSQTVSRLSSVVSVRRVGDNVAGDGVEALAARAEAMLARGDLAGAIKTLEAVKGPAAAPLAPWLRDARLRLAAERVVADLTVRALRSTGGPP